MSSMGRRGRGFEVARGNVWSEDGRDGWRKTADCEGREREAERGGDGRRESILVKKKAEL